MNSTSRSLGVAALTSLGILAVTGLVIFGINTLKTDLVGGTAGLWNFVIQVASWIAGAIGMALAGLPIVLALNEWGLSRVEAFRQTETSSNSLASSSSSSPSSLSADQTPAPKNDPALVLFAGIGLIYFSFTTLGFTEILVPIGLIIMLFAGVRMALNLFVPDLVVKVLDRPKSEAPADNGENLES